jgi:hypothetical protein
MREIRKSGSEGGGAGTTGPPYPYANTYYGDGSPIEPKVLDQLRAAYNAETVSFPWQKGDLLMLDNMLVAHGRSPFVGPRQILVGMAELVDQEQVAL